MRHTAAWVAAAWLTMGSIAGAAEAVDRVSRTVPLAAGTLIRVDATIANLTITESNRPDVRIDVERRAPASADLLKFPVAIDTGAGILHLSVVQRDDGRDPALKSTISITAPLGAGVSAVRVFEGRVRVANVRSSCDVDLRRGAIEGVELAGRVRLEVGIGSLEVRDSELTAGGMMRLRVFNGPLRVQFDRPPESARILALTLNGTITSDIPLTMKNRIGPRFGESTLGAGDPVLSMDVVKGDIQVTVARR